MSSTINLLIVVIVIIIIILSVYFYKNNSYSKSYEESEVSKTEPICFFSSELTPNKITLIGRKKYKGFSLTHDFILQEDDTIISPLLIPSELDGLISAVVPHYTEPSTYVMLFSNKEKKVYIFNFLSSTITETQEYSKYMPDFEFHISAVTLCQYRGYSSKGLIMFDEITGNYYIYLFGLGKIVEVGKTRTRWPNIPYGCKISSANYVSQGVIFDEHMPMLLTNSEFEKYLIISLQNGNVLGSGFLP